MASKKKDSLINQVIKAFNLHEEEEEMLYYDPFQDPINFLKCPLGVSIRTLLSQSLSTLSSTLAFISLLAERYPHLLSDEDRKWLDEAFFRANRIFVKRK